jgi:hypothetical protein
MNSVYYKIILCLIEITLTKTWNIIFCVGMGSTWLYIVIRNQCRYNIGTTRIIHNIQYNVIL